MSPSDIARRLILFDGLVLLSLGLNERSRLDTCLALAGCRRERPLSRGKPRDGVAARGFGRLNGKAFARLVRRAWAAERGPFARYVAGAGPICADGRAR